MYENILLGFEFEIETSGIDDTYRLIDEVSHITGYDDHYVHNYHSSMHRTVAGKWRVESDSSIFGAEFISPPIYYNDAKEMVKDFFKVIANSPNAMTTNHCGLHVGMSINGTVEGLDLSSFLVSLDQRLIASLWPERINSRYAKNIGKQMEQFRCGSNNINTENFATLLFCSRYSFISLKEFNHKRYLELRIPGGENYHCKFKELFVLIDHVASKMLLNHSTYSPSLSTTINKKCTKKIVSYVNRIYKRSKRNDVSDFKTANKKLGSKEQLSLSVMSTILELTITHVEFISANSQFLWDKLNKDYFLYNLIKYCIIYRKEYASYNIDDRIAHFLGLIKRLAPTIDVPKKESTYNKVKMFKQWNRLPTSLLINLLSSIDSKPAYKYLIKYVQGGVLHAIVTDSKGILKKHAITHAYKYNKVE